MNEEYFVGGEEDILRRKLALVRGKRAELDRLKPAYDKVLDQLDDPQYVSDLLDTLRQAQYLAEAYKLGDPCRTALAILIEVRLVLANALNRLEVKFTYENLERDLQRLKETLPTEAAAAADQSA